MYKSYRYINAGTNEYYRWGQKAQDRLLANLIPNEKGFLTLQCDGGKYWTFGTSEGKYGLFAKYKNTFFSVKEFGIYGEMIVVHKDSPKAAAFIQMINDLVNEMKHGEHWNAPKTDEEE